MEITSTTLILVGIICIVLGFFASVLVNTLKEEPEPEQEQNLDPPGGLKGKYVVVSRLWRERKSGTLLVEVDGKTLVSPQPLSDAQRSELENAARDFRAWLGMGLTGIQQPIDPTASVPQSSGNMPQDSHSQILPNHSVLNPTAVPREVKNVGSVPVKPISPIKHPVNPDIPAISDTNKSIVMQIEDILQDIISGGPYEDKIHLVEDPIRGVIVNVGNERFEGIESVTDPEIKAILRAAVTAWEKK